MNVPLGILAIAACGVIGLIEWTKYLVPKAPKWVWHVLLLPACVLAGLAVDGSIGVRLLSGGFLLLVTQVGYQLIVQSALGILRVLLETLRSKAGAP